MKKIFIFLTLFICLFTSNVLAISFTYNGNDVTLPDADTITCYDGYSVTNDFVICWNHGDNTYILYLCSDDFSGNVYYDGSSEISIKGGRLQYCKYNTGLNKWDTITTRTESTNNSAIVYSTIDVYKKNTSTIIYPKNEPEPVIVYPFIANTTEDLATGKFDSILITPGTFSSSENIELYIYNATNADDVYSKSPLFKTTLNSNSSYYKSVTVDNVTEFWYEIPRSKLGITFSNGNTYLYSLLLGGAPIQEISATIGGLSEEDVMNNNFENLEQTIIDSNKEITDSIDKQTEAIEENNKTSKNIFERIGDILSYINPFSENFFAYKLVELIIDALKSLFVPSDDFFSNWLDDLNAYFGEAFGILYYPAELIIDFLNRVGNIAETNTAIISVPSFTLSFMGHSATFFEDMSYDLNTILENDTFKTIHDIYLIFTDIILWLSVVYLAGKMLRTIIGGMGDEIENAVETSQESERSYEKYKQYQSNRQRYKEENKKNKRK